MSRNNKRFCTMKCKLSLNKNKHSYGIMISIEWRWELGWVRLGKGVTRNRWLIILFQNIFVCTSCTNSIPSPFLHVFVCKIVLHLRLNVDFSVYKMVMRRQRSRALLTFYLIPYFSAGTRDQNFNCLKFKCCEPMATEITLVWPIIFSDSSPCWGN
jgi:hypothetical protein